MLIVKTKTLQEFYRSDDGKYDENGNRNEKTSQPETEYEFKLVWHNILAFVVLHSIGAYSLYKYVLLHEAKVWTYIFGTITAIWGSLGVTAGSHRLWSHKSYKAKWPLRLMLMFMQTLAFQNHIYEWSRDHRVHHKFTDTDADPHNIKRGFFFAHMGWLCIKKHPDVKNKGKTIDMSDLEQDGIVMFQRKFYPVLMPLVSFVIPTLIPWYFWGETLEAAFCCAAIGRYTITLHLTWCINSVTHTFGYRPFDKNITPTDNFLFGIIGTGEGWHNYHHVFPWDYKTSELGKYHMNWTRSFIDFFAKIGWAYDLKTVSDDMIRKRVLRTGDGTHRYSKLKSTADKLNMYINSEDLDEEVVWGWDDKDMRSEDRSDAKIINISKEE